MTIQRENSFPNNWGVYDDNLVAVFDVDACTNFEYKNGGKVSKFPIETGSFTVCNKTREPFDAKIKFAVGGDSKRISEFLMAMEKLIDSTDMFHIKTPEAFYSNVTFTGYAYKRSAEEGANILVAALDFTEVRQVTSQYTSVSLPVAKVKKISAASKKEEGNKQPGNGSELKVRHIDPQTAIAQAYADQGKAQPGWLPDALRGNRVMTPGGLSTLNSSTGGQ